MPTREEILDEDRRVRLTRLIAHAASRAIMRGDLSRAQAEAVVGAARSRILALFPGSDATFEILYARKFHRLIAEHTPPDPVHSRVN